MTKELRKELSALILTHEQYGSHLDAQENTINPKLEEKNFEDAGKCLAEVWSAVALDNYLTIADAKCVCKHCGFYFASNVMLKKHIIFVHKITGKCQPEVCRVRPLRIAARRQQELMAVIAFTENVEFADWMDEDVIDIRGLTIPEDVKMPVYSMNEHISSPWEEES
ncbi:hypothetical protein AVEN_620-1 [Araneus ventricosus]|uniref:C2H2-type domain-containing protein n=1 Tax=Araneus ventricosus TaxID=182803 RepID=A0A4Y2EKF1_ARAVE|nr:hypothetical protein AVEN_620-1 [Araneus ventricosus]